MSFYNLAFSFLIFDCLHRRVGMDLHSESLRNLVVPLCRVSCTDLFCLIEGALVRNLEGAAVIAKIRRQSPV